MAGKAYIKDRKGGGFLVGYQDGDYLGPEAEVYAVLNGAADTKPTWAVVCTDDYEGHAMLNAEALPQLRKALAKLAKELKAA